jgi:hypothetical protein
MNSSTIDICFKYGLITRTNALTGSGDKYQAARELATTENLSHSAAMRRVNLLIDRIQSGLDPTRDNRGGARMGAGRKRKAE